MNNLLNEKDTRVVMGILVEQLGVQETQLTAEARLKEDLGADSLALVEIAMALEERFNVSIPDEDWERVGTVGELFEALVERLSAEARGARS